ncbi:MAG: biotin--[acetyl-CoA-carboxylase] ligase [Candidatus Firestonebacteria bacterium]
MSRIDTEEEILELLRKSPNKYVSGEDLSRKFKVSRTAIWKNIHSLIAQGYEIESHTHLGYKLLSAPDILLAAEIRNGLNTKYVGQNMYCFNEIGSTNDFALKYTEKGVEEGFLVTAEKQTHGKGRLGRNWISPPNLGLWFSVILKPRISPFHSSKITFISGLSVVDAVKKVTGEDAVLKWPNDVFFRGKKLCGILTEMRAEMDVINYLVIGMGVNVNFSRSDFPESLKHTATSLKIELKQEFSRVKLLKEILKNLEDYYELFKREGFDPILNRWKDNCATLNTRVKITQGKDIIEGFAQDVDDDCSLLVRLDSGIIYKTVSGDVS